MSSSVLGSLSLGYQLLWNHARQPAAVRLFVGTPGETPPDARHLLATLADLWPGQAPALLLSVQSKPLLLDLLAQGRHGDPWLEVPQAWLADPGTRERIEHSRQHDLPLVWQGETGAQPAPDTVLWFDRFLCRLSVAQAEAALALSRRQDAGAAARPAPDDPVQPHRIYAGVSSQALARHCLDQQGAWALAGWPEDDVLRARRGEPAQPGQRVIGLLLAAIEADASFELIERLLSDEPILAYRFLQHVNSPDVGLRHEVESVRQGLMALGLSSIQAWLQQQQAQACADPDLDPLRLSLTLRAHLMDKLLEPGEEAKLRNEIYLCGLLSGLAPLLGESTAALLDRLPLSWRVRGSLLEEEGPYSPYLRVALALASPDTAATHELCDAHALDMEEVNRALLRALAAVTAPPVFKR